MPEIPRGGFDRLPIAPSIFPNVSMFEHAIQSEIGSKSLDKLRVCNRIFSPQSMFVMRNDQLEFKSLFRSEKQISQCE